MITKKAILVRCSPWQYERCILISSDFIHVPGYMTTMRLVSFDEAKSVCLDFSTFCFFYLI